MDIKKILNIFFTALNSHVDRGALAVVKAVDTLGKSVDKSSESQSRAIGRLEKQFEAATARMEKPTFDVNVDMDPLLAELRDIQAAMVKVAGKKGPDLSVAEGYLKMILGAIKENSPKDFPIDAMDAVFGKLKPKDSVKFDDTQMKGLMAALTNSGNSMAVGGGVLAARNVDVDNVTMASANTEYSYTFPANTVGFELRLRADDVPLLVAYTTGKLPTSGDGLAYLTVPAYFIEKTAGLDWSGKTIYVQTGSASQTLEVITYTA